MSVALWLEPCGSARHLGHAMQRAFCRSAGFTAVFCVSGHVLTSLAGMASGPSGVEGLLELLGIKANGSPGNAAFPPF